MENPIQSISDLTGIEELAEEILSDKAEIVALDKRRNGTREGLRGLAKAKTNKTWLTVGPLLVKMPTPKVKTLLEQDQIATDVEINKLRSELKVKVNRLRELECQEPVKGFSLKPLSRDEFSAVGQALGHHA